MAEVIKKETVVGIDLGTTNSCIAQISNGVGNVIINREGDRLTPSFVYFDEQFIPSVGKYAVDKLGMEPKRVIYSAKRFIGLKNKDLDASLLSDLVSFDTSVNFDGAILENSRIDISDPNEFVRIKVGSKWFLPEEILSVILRKLKEDAQMHLGAKVSECVITVPAYYTEIQKRKTLEAANLAGLDVLRMINEPTAAALAYGLQEKIRGRCFVFDFGGGTLDISIVDVKNIGGSDSFYVVTTGGDTALGGNDFDKAIANIIIEKHNIPQNQETLSRVIKVAEDTKKILSNKDEAEIILPYLYVNPNNPGMPVSISDKITKEEFLSSVSDLLRRVDLAIDKTLIGGSGKGVDINSIDWVVLVGGMSNVPYVREIIEKKFKNATIMSSIHTMEVVGIGAATQASIIKKEIKDALLQDIVPFEVGLELYDGSFEALIERNTPLPARGKNFFTTSQDNQESVDIHVLQKKEGALYSLGRFALTQIPKLPKSVPRIEVECEIDQNGVLQVTAKETSTKKTQDLKVSLKDI